MSQRIPQSYSGAVTNTAVGLDNNGPTTLRLVVLGNTTAASAKAWLQVFNLPVASVTVGTTVPVLSIMVPGDGCVVVPVPEGGLNLKGNGLTIAATATRAGSGAANLDVNIGWGE